MNKASGVEGIQVELFQILKDDAVKVLHSICQQNWKTHQRPPDWKKSVFIPIPKKANAKKCSIYMHNYTNLTHQESNAQNSTSQASTVHELRTSICSSWIYKRQSNQRLNCQHLLGHRKTKRIPEKRKTNKKHLLLLH